MAQGRGSAFVAAANVAVLLLCLTFLTSNIEAATYTVGGNGGWTFNVVNWPKGKSFRAGDTIVFNYDPKLHNVVVVDKAGYSSCRSPAGAKVYRSGKDQIKLVKGQNNFICSIAGHCESGMKVAITAV